MVQLGKTSIPALLEAVMDVQPRVRGLACFALGELKTPSEEVLHALGGRLEDGDHEVRYTAARALGSLKTVPDGIVEQLQLMRQADADTSVRGGAEEALLAITGTPPKPLRTIDELLGALTSGNPQEREEAINAIGKLGLAKSEAASQERVFKALAQRLLHDDYFQSRSSAALAMWRIGRGPPFVIEALITALDDSDPQVKGMAALILGNFGRLSAQAVPRLRAMATDEKHPERAKVARQAIERIMSGDAA